ncbi:hypothetical protein CCHR01_13116 [Colletotrichum chrysophilum]|uniref:Uncharacterized protein n=1 Tax=Colletotrichum chrysophilum TaxID=1836956 RepID=A0AAD9AB73_9PEZI|nr:hypothetical protein CCHR01_13116 [Colletotrichum chrysophilum]
MVSSGRVKPKDAPLEAAASRPIVDRFLFVAAVILETASSKPRRCFFLTHHQQQDLLPPKTAPSRTLRASWTKLRSLGNPQRWGVRPSQPAADRALVVVSTAARGPVAYPEVPSAAHRPRISVGTQQLGRPISAATHTLSLQRGGHAASKRHTELSHTTRASGRGQFGHPHGLLVPACIGECLPRLASLVGHAPCRRG